MDETNPATNVAVRECIRCGMRRHEDAMLAVGSGWACNIGGGVTCAMQLIYRGYEATDPS